MLGEGEIVGLVVEALRLVGVLFLASRAHHPETAAGDVSESHVEPVEAAAVHEEYPERKLRPLVGRKERGVQPQAEAVAAVEVGVGAQNRVHRVQHHAEQAPGVLEVDLALNPVSYGLGALPEGVRGEGTVGIETVEKEVGDRGGLRQRALGERVDALEAEGVLVVLDEHLVAEVAEARDDLRPPDAKTGVPVGEVERAVLDPLVAQEIRADLRPQLALRLDGTAAGGLDDEAEEGDRAVGAVVDDVEVRAVDVDLRVGQTRRDALEHAAGGGVPDRDEDAAQGGVGLAVEDDGRAVGAGELPEEGEVLADP